MIDLGHWVDEAYRVPGESVTADDARLPSEKQDDDVDG